jgi:hypothetical protein
MMMVAHALHLFLLPLSAIDQIFPSPCTAGAHSQGQVRLEVSWAMMR